MSFTYYEENTEKLNQDHKRDQEAEGKTFFLKTGTSLIRVMPPYSQAGTWYKEVLEHKLNPPGGKFTRLACMRAVGENCLLCNEGERLIEEGRDEGDASKTETGSKFRPSKSYLLNIAVYSEPDGKIGLKDGIYVLACGAMVKRQLLEFHMDTDWGGLTNIQNGLDLKIVRSGQGQFNTKYDVRPLPNRSDISERFASEGIDINTLSLHNLDTYLRLPEPHDAQAVLDAMKAVPGFQPEASSAVPVGAGTPAPVAPAPVAAPVAPAATAPVAPASPSVPVAPPAAPVGPRPPVMPPAPPAPKGD